MGGFQAGEDWEDGRLKMFEVGHHDKMGRTRRNARLKNCRSGIVTGIQSGGLNTGVGTEVNKLSSRIYMGGLQRAVGRKEEEPVDMTGKESLKEPNLIR